MDPTRVADAVQPKGQIKTDRLLQEFLPDLIRSSRAAALAGVGTATVTTIAYAVGVVGVTIPIAAPIAALAVGGISAWVWLRDRRHRGNAKA